jgi:hypothetical protein
VELEGRLRPISDDRQRASFEQHIDVPQQDRQVTDASAAHLPLASREANQRAAPIQPALGRPQSSRFARAGSAILVIAVIAFGASKLLPLKESKSSAARNVPAMQQAIPLWAPDLNAASLNGWIEIRNRFGLSDTAVGTAIRILKTNNRYPPGHSLRDLTMYPAQVERAFAILAGFKAENAFDLGALTEELQGRLASGARFPDESPGSRYFSNLDPGLYNNAVVLAIVELLHRRQDEPDVRNALAALRSSGS